MYSGLSTWWAAKARCMPAKIGSSSQVSRGGRGWGNCVSHISRPWVAGSACSSRCSAVVPVRGSPIRKIGRSIDHVGVLGAGRELGLGEQPTHQGALDLRALEVVAQRGQPGLGGGQVVDEDPQALLVGVAAEVAQPGGADRGGGDVVVAADVGAGARHDVATAGVQLAGAHRWNSPQSTLRTWPVTAELRSVASISAARATSAGLARPLAGRWGRPSRRTPRRGCARTRAAIQSK